MCLFLTETHGLFDRDGEFLLQLLQRLIWRQVQAVETVGLSENEEQTE